MSRPGDKPPPPSASVADDVPDPDEDDLDDLDDMLDDFSTLKVEPPPVSAGPGASAAPPTATSPAGGDSSALPDVADLEAILGDDDFAKELAKNMASFLGDNDMQAQLKDLLAEMDTHADTPPTAATASAGPVPGFATPKPSSSTPAAPAPESEQNFQSSINDTIRRLQQSNRQATEATTTAAADPSEDFMAAMLKQLAEGGGADGAGGDEDFSKLLLGMMEELTNRDILYEPMKELDDRFPRWMAENAAKVPADDMARYEQQRVVVRDIVARYDRPEYDDANAADREYIVDKMHQMQAAGAPPPDLVGDMSSASDLLNMEEGCNPQ